MNLKSMTRVLIRIGEDTEAEGDYVKLEAEIDRIPLISQGMSRIPGRHQKLGRGIELIFPQSLQKESICLHLYFKVLFSRT